MKPHAALAACLALAVLTSGCATTAGAGKDIQSAGKALTKSSEDARK
jgi:predicted small secreted protein